jgi:hypothetical protein
LQPFSSDPKSEKSFEFCKSQLLRYKPWSLKTPVLDEYPNTPQGWIDAWEEFKISDYGKKAINYWEDEIRDCEAYLDSHSHEVEIDDMGLVDEDQEPEARRQGEWMMIANNITTDRVETNHQNDDIDSMEYWQRDSLLYSDFELSQMVNWINIEKQKDIGNRDFIPIDISLLNREQRFFYNIVTHYVPLPKKTLNYSHVPKPQLLSRLEGDQGSFLNFFKIIL